MTKEEIKLWVDRWKRLKQTPKVKAAIKIWENHLKRGRV